jgi:hypothetical protein
MATLSRRPRPRSGLTILEMLVSTAMLSLIVLGLTAMLIQTQKAFKTGIRQNTITDAGRSIMDMITGDLRQMSDAQNTNVFNFFWGAPNNVVMIVNYLDGLPIRTNELNDIFILEHTNTSWVGVGYAVSNYPGASRSNGLGIGTLYRYETNWTSLAPVFTNDLYSVFRSNINNQTFTNLYWHRVADGVIDLKVNAFDEYGNTNYYNQLFEYGYVSYPIGGAPLPYPNIPTNDLPYGVEVEFGILEPDTLVQARGLTANPTALANFLSSNAAPKMEVFRQRVTVAAAVRQ